MKTKSLLFALFAFAISTHAQSLITLQHNNTTTFYTSIDNALSSAVDGDNIYLPGGYITSNSTVKINHAVHLYGVGYRQDSNSFTNKTTMQNNIEISTWKKGCIVSGLYVSKVIIDDSVNYFTLSRCWVTGELDVTGNTHVVNNITLNEDYIAWIYGTGSNNYQTSTLHAHKCLIGNSVNYSPFHNLYGGNFYNCVIYSNTSLTSTYYGSCTDLHLYNCIIQANTLSSTACYYKNCILNNMSASDTANLRSNNSGTNTCIFTPRADSIFSGSPGVNLPFPANELADLSLLHLKTGSKGIKGGTDSTDIGIFGTKQPFKLGGLPIVPHIISVKIPATTNASGDLPVKIKVEAQSR